MTKSTTTSINFTSCKSRIVQADFSGGERSRDGELLSFERGIAAVMPLHIPQGLELP